MQIFGSDIKPTTGKMKVLSLSNSNESMSWPFLLQQKVKSRNSMKWKGLSTVTLVLLSKSRSTVLFLMIFFESPNSMKMRRTFNCHFGFDFTLFSEIRNSIKMKRTFNCHFDFVFTVQASLALLDLFGKSQLNEMKKTFSCHFGLFSKQNQADPFCWSVLKVAISRYHYRYPPV